jgi:DNA-binding transcriptional MerR regulator
VKGFPWAPGTTLTVDDLARRARTTTRNVRALQTLGLVPPPTLVGRKGVYGREHLDRVRAVLRLQSDGFSLAAIAALLRAWEEGMSLEDVLGLGASARSGKSEGGRAAGDPYGLEGWAPAPGGRALSVVPTNLVALAG